jgi:hypothetical protein
VPSDRLLHHAQISGESHELTERKKDDHVKMLTWTYTAQRGKAAQPTPGRWSAFTSR